MRRLRIALHAYPRRVREAEGDVLLGLAEDLAGDGSSVNREALGLVGGGLAARAGALARAPWDDALGRIAVPLAAAFAALILGRAAHALWPTAPAWPGWSWVLTLLAPLLALAGVLAGRRAPALIGAMLLVALGVAQGNSLPATTANWFSGTLQWDVQGGVTNGYGLAALGCAIPGALVLLAAAARLPHTRRPAHWSVAIAWTVTGSLAVFMAGRRQVTFAGLHLDAVGLFLVGYGLAVAAFAVFMVARRSHRDRGAQLAALLAVATAAPAVALYFVSALPLPDVVMPALLGLLAMGCGAAMVRAAARTAAPKRG